ncbi:shikimate 5-dehydrogenase [Sphingomonas sp. SFZ2018-12]|uniref:shikimate 5-dehydrogenase n=1 Tax=Sphingomonas sp. SFZ2018-12 TaxID=2683197 RepID=UPI001F0F18F0|nr:shikimate 5-dehydrogenase [Sphingomonas sp. SFZ2018-12]MCH4893337.1 shikimate 5-dehydrogenase [Sphingomonas sp. SFZ2018-12]
MSKLSINRDTQLCMSLSARPGNFGTRFQNHLYDALGLDFVYKSFTTADIAAAIGGIRALGVRGCAISMPFKEAVIPLIDALDPSAAAIGAVNTIVNEDGKLTGYNTDYTAVAALMTEHRVPQDIDFVLRGSGGMGKAVASALADHGYANGTIVTRDEASGRALADRLGYRWARAVTPGPGLLINVTPIGMAGGPEADALAFDEAAVRAATMLFDVVAIPVETPLVRLARRLGKPVIIGDEVLVRQGLEQFVLYTGCRPSADHVARAARFALG